MSDPASNIFVSGEYYSFLAQPFMEILSLYINLQLWENDFIIIIIIFKGTVKLEKHRKIQHVTKQCVWHLH